MQAMEGERKSVNSELWHACAGPNISLPTVGSLVVYFPQGHSEQLAASTFKEINGHIPNYPNLQSHLVCQLHNVALHADLETDEVFAQMTLQPVNDQEKELYMTPDVGLQSRQPADFFCKILTASDTSTHGGFSVPRRSAEKVFPPLDFNKQPPAQELRVKDLHGMEWTFRHIFRGQPKRHLLTTGWSVFVSAKRLVAGDSVLFIRDDKGQLLLGIRRASCKQSSVLPSSVLSSDTMHIGVLAAAAHAAATNSRFQVFYNPRTSPSEFVIPLSKYRKAVNFTQVSVGMRFRMVFETEESTSRRYMGTVTGIGDLDGSRWPGSKWRNLEVGWDESSAGERPRRVSLWEIEPVSTPFLICPPPFTLRPKRPPGLLGDDNDLEGSMKRCLTWLRGENNTNRDLMNSTLQGLGGDSSWLQFQPRAEPAKPEMYDVVTAAALQEMRTLDASKVLQQSPLQQQGQFRLLQQRHQSLHQQETQQSHIMWSQANGNQQVFPAPQQLPSLPQQQVLPLSQPQTHLTTQSQSLALPQAGPLTITQPPLSSIPLTQPRLQSPLPHQLYSAQLQQQQQQPSQLIIQSSPQGQSQQSLSQTQAVLPQSQLALPQTVLSQSQPALPQTLQSLSQPHQSLPPTQQPLLHTPQSLSQQSLLHTQQSLSSQVQQHSMPQTQQQNPPMGELPSHLSQMSYSRSQASLTLPVIRPYSAFTESELGFASPSGNANSFSMQGMLGRSQGVAFSSDDSGQLASLLRANQSVMQPPQQQQQENIVQQQQSSIVQPSPSPLQQQQQHTQEALPPVLSSLPQIETQLTGSWFPFSSRDGTQCESPMLSNVQIGQSDTSSAITSYSLPPEPLDNPPLVPPTTGPSQTRFTNISKEMQCRPLNDPAMGSLSSPAGSFTSTTPDGSRLNAGVITNGVPEDSVLSHTCSWSQGPAPVRTFTKVHKSGSVGRSIDLSRLKSYEELRWELARMFNIEGQLEDPHRAYWQLVFVDNVGDILLVGDDPWDEFVSCVRAIKILSTAQVLQMNQEGLEQLSNLPMQQQTSSSSEDCHIWKDA